MEEKKRVLPGEHLASCEEFEPGENTFTDNDETYSSTYGEVEVNEGAISVNNKGKTIVKPDVDAKVYCIVTRADPNKARLSCMLESEVDGNGRGPDLDAVLLVTNISRAHVETIRDAVKVGDIIKGRIYKIKEGGEIEISILGKDFGVIKAFCGKCRSEMSLNGSIFICNSCGWKERRKIPGGDDSFTRSGGREGGRDRRSDRGSDRGRRPFGERREGGNFRRPSGARRGHRERPLGDRK
ncbi:MAG: exosome complex RNA-binding protein Csl4 [Candidatus Micrarchaeota archaeon]